MSYQKEEGLLLLSIFRTFRASIYRSIISWKIKIKWL